MKKLITISAIVTSICLNISVNAQNLQQQQQYSFPPQYQNSPVGSFASDSTLYLPPETQTSQPLFPSKNGNLQYQYLPATGTKAPSFYPSPFPMTVSSIPNFDEEEEDDEDDNGNNNQVKLSSPQAHKLFNFKANHTTDNHGLQSFNKKETRSLHKTLSYNQPIDRVDIKFPYKFGPTQSPQMTVQTPANRRMIMSTETVKSEPLIGDQIKAPSFQGVHYIQPPPGFISSTTEPAVPILRLSNEMDLDGSYSYEALGADQTHYVQHSRMENMGTDKEEQVVEGSYSYVGDNGQTFTVHYVADSNGFRASGDHLPVGPPIPEIIQRSIQYNLAEEAKRPHHLQEWQDEERNNEVESRVHRYSVAPPPPQRSLFTGRTPEAFSYNFVKSSNVQNNNIVPAPSSPAPVIAHLEHPKEQPKQINGPISPQITFLASQGAHVPSMNQSPPQQQQQQQQHQQQQISRVFSANNEKSTMPKLMNYELTTIENEQDNKPLWRWQYGLNSNTAKNAISRSSAHSEDEVTMNFNEMTPEQYKYMIRSQFDTNEEENEKHAIPSSTEPLGYNNDHSNDNNKITENHANLDERVVSSSREPASTNWYHESFNEVQSPELQQTSFNDDMNIMSRGLNSKKSNPNLITQNDFIPPSQTVTRSYDYYNDFYEPRKLRASKTNSVTVLRDDYQDNSSENIIERPIRISKNVTKANNWSNKDDYEEKDEDDIIVTSPKSIRYTTPTFQDINNHNEFRPIQPLIELQSNSDENKNEHILSTTTEIPAESMLKNNIFLRNLLRSPKIDMENITKENLPEASPKPNTNNMHVRKEEKIPKVLQSNHNTFNEVKYIRSKPVDVSDILNYVSMKNHFESNKIRPKSQKNLNYPTKPENYIPFLYPHSKLGEGNNDRHEVKEQQSDKPVNIIKKYKTLQRNNNVNVDQTNGEGQLRRDLLTKGVDLKNLPLSHLPPLGRAGPTIKSYLPPLFI